jgi:hypothetical protein
MTPSQVWIKSFLIVLIVCPKDIFIFRKLLIQAVRKKTTLKQDNYNHEVALSF